MVKMRQKTSTLEKWTELKPLELLLFVFSMVKYYIPSELRRFIYRYVRQFLEFMSPYIHLYIDEYSNGQYYATNWVYNRVRAYLSHHGCKNSTCFRLDAPARGKRALKVSDGEEIVDRFKGVKVWWVWTVVESRTSKDYKYNAYKLMFHRKYKELISGEYLDYVIEEGKTISEKNRTRRLYMNRSIESHHETKVSWTSVTFDHPANFENLAMDPIKKREIVEDLMWFSKSKDFYARVGKAWKRGYLLYGPPGTGKSTMIAAMANLLGYDVYDLELTSVGCNEDLRRLLIGTGKKSLIAIEDIDCTLEITHKRDDPSKSTTTSTSTSTNTSNTTTSTSTKAGLKKGKKSSVTLSGLLNFIDGICSALEGERIIVFTTNSLAKLDPALIRAGRMDKHIEMSYCCFEGFKVLAKKYLLVETHPKFEVIKGLFEVTKMTPADVGECLMPKVPNEEDVEGCLERLICALEKARDDQVAMAKAAEIENEEEKEEEVLKQQE